MFGLNHNPYFESNCVIKWGVFNYNYKMIPDKSTPVVVIASEFIKLPNYVL